MEENMLKNEVNLSKYACYDKMAIRLKPIIEDIRPNYFRDIDRIIYSLSYARYIDKTQVFSRVGNDHISKRIIHVQMVSKIARTIGRALNLNEDLIEAIALGHDLGHVPFAHTGERILNKISLENNEGTFMHNAQSVRTLMYVDNHGLGENLTIQVLDGILCHNGELEQIKYYPVSKTIEDFFKDYNDCFKVENKNLKPMTLEGCVVKISDIISYLGKDVEDAITLGVIKRCDIPEDVVKVLGNNNSKIINTIILDIINNSLDKPYIQISPKIFEAITKLKKFNYEFIYSKANTKKDLKNYENMFRKLFNACLNDLELNQNKTNIKKTFLSEMNDEYLKNTSLKRKVIDYIAGMTDEYFVKQCQLIDKNIDKVCNK